MRQINIETKEIGVDVGVETGTYHNTEYVDGKIQLTHVGETVQHKPVYEIEGYWESEVIDLVDKFREYDKVVLSKVHEDIDVVAILTRVSDDGVNFDDYTATTPEGKVQSEMKRFIQVKLSFFAGMTNEGMFIDDFSDENSINNWEDNTFIEISEGSLKLRKEYSFEMNKKETWEEEGSVHKITVNKDNWERIEEILIQ